jgi:hypothetical protein
LLTGAKDYKPLYHVPTSQEYCNLKEEHSSFYSLGIVIVLFYYFFAIIGIEAFAGVELKSCCRYMTNILKSQCFQEASNFHVFANYFCYRNFSIQDEYEEDGYYYLNNFNDFFHSYGR